ncbi:choline/ethanolamine kinase family protein [Cryptosporidium muris RN66]|uniref:ethanolamine kinase n=1 Tax=Cryptosporidium muris (strain RN66) TaxID=441375 RepID=B6AA09_CRYMR|nr:choline/ethanolamine kinase family protein [Cryptosporidium muris RN66]EEA05050.1 choline/ethanolamine kinase family protein [Cryptosporidium muris RN66]|eukprot:XP_002139399.1 choline/ethanolamine kinase family protein [Cryptosporidium muris RN66]
MTVNNLSLTGNVESIVLFLIFRNTIQYFFLGTENLNKYEGATIESNFWLNNAKDICWKLLETEFCSCCSSNSCLETEMITGGLSNKLVKVWAKKNSFCNVTRQKNIGKLDKIYSVRFYSKERHLFVDEKRDQLIQKLLSDFEMSKQVMSYFSGGQIEEYIHGHSLSVEQIRQKSIYLKVSENLAKLHSIPIHEAISEQIRRQFGEIEDKTDSPISILWPTMSVWIDRAEIIVKSSDNHPCLNINFKELRGILKNIHLFLQRDIGSICCSPIVICHCDLLPGNIISTDEGNLKFIDYEFAGTAECAFDIANYFCEWAGFLCDWKYLPTESEQREFVYNYLRYLLLPPDSIIYTENLVKKLNVQNNDRDTENICLHIGTGIEITDQMVDCMVSTVQLYMLVSNIFWGLWGICKSEVVSGDFDYGTYALKRLSSIYGTEFQHAINKIVKLI